MKNSLILSGIKICKKWISPSTQKQKAILIVSTTALGDTLWATPALESLRKSYPNAKISVLTSPIGEEALRYNPWIDQIFILQKPMLFKSFGLWRRLKKEKFQEIVIFHASQRLILPLCSLLGAQRIVGTRGINKGLDALLTDRVAPVKEHEILRRLRLIERIGAKTHSETLSFFLTPDEHIMWSKQKPRIALHPGSKDPFKRWPIEHFVEVGRQLSNLGYEIFVTGTEHELMQQVAAKIPGATLSDPTLTLRQFAARLISFDLLISNDTGPVHLACALNVPVIALYSPTDPLLCGPHKAVHAHTISKAPTCECCLKRSCRRPFCLMQIGPADVINLVRKSTDPGLCKRS